MTEFGIISEVYSARAVRRVQGIRVVNETSRLWARTAYVDVKLFTVLQTSYQVFKSSTSVQNYHLHHTSSDDKLLGARADSRSRARAGKFRDISDISDITVTRRTVSEYYW